MTSIINTIKNTTNTSVLLSLITDELLKNYKSFIRPTVETSTFDYTTLSTKAAYDSFTNTSTSTISVNTETKTDRIKSIITYSKQYTTNNNLRDYTYRIIKEEQSIVASANATSTVSPAMFTTATQTVEQTFTLHVLKTTTIQSFNTNVREDFLLMPIIFASDREVAPDTSSTNYALRSMLLNYYTSKVTQNYTGYVVLGLSISIGALSLVLNFSWGFFSVFAIISILPVILSFYNGFDVLDFMVNNYLLFSGVLGILISIVHGINNFIINNDYKRVLSTR